MARGRDFTQGSIPRHLAVLFGPLLAASVFQQLYAIADALLIGYCVGAEAFAAVGIAQTLTNLLAFLMVGLASGPAVAVGHSLGARNAALARRQWGSAAVAAMAAACVLGAVAVLVAAPVLAALRSPEAMMGDALAYPLWGAASLPAVLGANLTAAMLRAQGNAAAPFVALSGAAVLNVGLDVLFMGPCGWGVAGAAAATLLSQAASALACALCLQRRQSPLRLARADLRPRARLLAPMMRRSGAASVQAASLYIGKILVQGVVNGLGTDAIVAYAAAMRIEGLAQAAGEAGQNAGVAVIAQNHGAQKPRRTRAAFLWILAMLTSSAALIGAAMFVAAGPLVYVFSAGSEGAVAEGVPYLQVIAVAYVMCLGGNAWVAHFQGRGRAAVSLVATTVQIYLRFALSLLWAPALGLVGIAWATVAGWATIHVVSLAGMYVERRRARGASPMAASSVAPVAWGRGLKSDGREANVGSSV